MATEAEKQRDFAEMTAEKPVAGGTDEAKIARTEGFAESVARAAARDATRAAQISFYLGAVAATLQMKKAIGSKTKQQALTEADAQVGHFEHILKQIRGEG